MRNITKMFALLLAVFVVGATKMFAQEEATTITVSVGQATGTASGSGYFHTWTSNSASGVEGLKIYAPNNNGDINFNTNNGTIDWYSHDYGTGGQTYTIAAPEGYLIDGIKITGQLDNGRNTAVTETTIDGVSFNASSESTLEKTSVNTRCLLIHFYGYKLFLRTTVFQVSLKAGTQTEVTDMSGLDNTKAYGILPHSGVATRGTWYYNPNNPSYLCSTKKPNAVTADQTDTKQQFAFLKSDNGNYYIYNVAGEKFVSLDGDQVRLYDEPQSISNVTFLKSVNNGTDYTTHPVVVAFVNGGDYKHFGLSQGFTNGIVQYNSLSDGGNCVKIIEVAKGDFSEALEKIKAFENSSEITLNYQTNRSSWSTTKRYAHGSAIDATMDFYKDFVITNDPGSVTAEHDGQTFTVICTEDFPFTFPSDNTTSAVSNFSKLNLKGNGVKLSSEGALTCAGNDDTPVSLFAFERIDGTPYDVRLIPAGAAPAYVKANKDNEAPAIITDLDAHDVNNFTVLKNGTGFSLLVTGSEQACLNKYAGSGNVLVWNASGSTTNDGSRFTTEAVEAQPIEVTYNVTDATLNNTFTIENGRGLIGQNAALPILGGYYGKTTHATDSDPVVTAENNVIEVTTNSSFPVTASLEGGERKWHTLRTAQSESTYFIRLDNSNIASTKAFNTEDVPTFSKLGDALWCFEKISGNRNGFKIYNYKTQQAVTFASSNNQTKATLSNEGTEIVLSPNGDGFNIQYPGVSTACAGAHAEDGKWWGIWNAGGSPTHAKSRIVATSIDVESELSVAKAILKNDLGGYNGYLGAVLTYDESAIDAAESLTALETIYENTYAAEGNRTQLEPGKLYRLVSTATDGLDDYMVLGFTGDKAQSFAKSNSNVDLVWEVVAADGGKFKLLNKNAGKYLGVVVGGKDETASMVDETAAALCQIYQVTNEPLKWQIGMDGALFRVYCEKNGNINAWSEGERSQWYLIEATDLEVALNQAGDAYYASLYLPFDVQLNNDVKAYTAQVKDATTMTLESVADVPANNGVILKGTAATTSLKIASATSTIANNVLDGTNTALTITDKTAYYTLGGGSDGTVGFYHPNSTTLKANKAFYHNGATSTEGFVFNFGGETTGVEGVTTNEPNAPVYDLSGRRVLNPTHGVYVKNGKKFVIK